MRRLVVIGCLAALVAGGVAAAVVHWSVLSGDRDARACIGTARVCVVRSYLNAIADGSGSRACGYLIGEALRQRGGGDCGRRVASAARGMTPSRRELLRDAKTRVVVVRPRSSVIDIVNPLPMCKTDHLLPVVVVKQGRAWRISRFSDAAC